MNASAEAVNAATEITESRSKRWWAAASGGAVLAAQALLRALWLVVIPALLAGLTIRYLVPSSESLKASSFENDLARWSRDDPVTFAVGVFLIFALLARYWRFHVPGGWLMAALTPRLSRRIARQQLADVAAAAELERSLAKPKSRRRLEARLKPESLAALDGQLADVRAAVEAGDGGRARALRQSVARVAAPALRIRQLALNAVFFLGVGVAGLGAFYLRSNVFQSYRVLSESMLPTLQPGDHLGGNKRAYGLRLPGSNEVSQPTSPRRGDVVVFRMPTVAGPQDDMVKRVIGLPGDNITMHRGRPVINGWLVPNCHVGSYFYLSPSGKPVTGRLSVEFLEDSAYLTVHTPVLKPSNSYDVKPGEAFVIGDNRNASRDSRSFIDGGGRGVTLGDIVARADRLVVHAKRSGAFDVSTLFQPLSALNLNLDATDTSQLEAGIRTCLGPERRPKETRPPQAAAPPSAALHGNVARP